MNHPPVRFTFGRRYNEDGYWWCYHCEPTGQPSFRCLSRGWFRIGSRRQGAPRVRAVK